MFQNITVFFSYSTRKCAISLANHENVTEETLKLVLVFQINQQSISIFHFVLQFYFLFSHLHSLSALCLSSNLLLTFFFKFLSLLQFPFWKNNLFIGKYIFYHPYIVALNLHSESTNLKPTTGKSNYFSSNSNVLFKFSVPIVNKIILLPFRVLLQTEAQGFSCNFFFDVSYEQVTNK